MIESLTTSILGLGLPSLDQIKQASLDIISKLNLEGWFASLEPYHLGMITMALLTISLIFMVVNRNIIFMVNRQQDMENLINPYSDIRMLLAENQDRYRIARKILWQILQNHLAHSLGTPQYSLNTFPANDPGYITRSEYRWVGHTAITDYRIAHTLNYVWALHEGSLEILDTGRGPYPSLTRATLAHADPTILHAVIWAEDRRAMYEQIYREEKERRVRMGLER